MLVLSIYEVFKYGDEERRYVDFCVVLWSGVDTLFCKVQIFITSLYLYCFIFEVIGLLMYVVYIYVVILILYIGS